MARPNGARSGKQIIVWMDPELVAAIERARGETDRSSWIRTACERFIAHPDRPLFASTDPVASEAQPSQPERRDEARW